MENKISKQCAYTSSGFFRSICTPIAIRANSVGNPEMNNTTRDHNT